MIELDNITKIYRMGKVEVPALRGITLTIQSGEMVALVELMSEGIEAPRVTYHFRPMKKGEVF